MATRRAIRVRAMSAAQVGLFGNGVRFNAPLLDFSPFGLAVRTTHEAAPGTIYRLAVKIGDEYFRAAAVVRAILPGGLGMEFLAMSPADREMMRRLYLRLQMAARAG